MAMTMEDQPIYYLEELWLRIYRGTRSVSQRYHTEPNFEAMAPGTDHLPDERNSREASILLQDRSVKCEQSLVAHRRHTTKYLVRNFHIKRNYW